MCQFAQPNDWTATKLAEESGRSRQTIYYWIKRGYLKVEGCCYSGKGPRHYVIRDSAVSALLANWNIFGLR